MGKKMWIEVCVVSGRGLRRYSSSLWNLQWFAVAWIHPYNVKYCTKIDASGKPNPLWNTRFSTPLDSGEDGSGELALHVQVYSRDPLFLRERLLGSATIMLKEFLDKFESNDCGDVDEMGSFQLRKRNSNRSLGFVDVSIRISQEREDPTSSYLGGDEGFNLDNLKQGNAHDSLQPPPPPPPQPIIFQQPQTSYQMPIPPSYPHQPPPAPSNVGHISNLFHMTSNYAPSGYI